MIIFFARNPNDISRSLFSFLIRKVSISVISILLVISVKNKIKKLSFGSRTKAGILTSIRGFLDCS
jgi:hypothetical protein